MNINNKVYELDGLKKYPIDHGSIGEDETFAEKFRRIILDRIPQQQQKENKMNSQLRKLQTDMNTQVNEDIRYSLMAVVPDRRKENLKRLKLLKSKRQILLQIIENLVKRPKLPEPYEIHSYSKYTTTLNKSRPLEVNVNRLIVKDVNYNDQLNSSKLTTKDSQGNGNNKRQDDYFDDDSTDTCSDCESRLDEEESCEEGDRIESFYAFKFVPLREQNNDKTAKPVDKKSLDDETFKTFTNAELIEFYKDYGFQDLLNIIKKIEQEISICDRNVSEEIEKRTKFYVDDSRRTHNYNDFITTYLLMITEQKKLHEFIESKDTKTSVLTANSSTNEEKMDEGVPIKFFKEILTNYEDVLMNDECEPMAIDESSVAVSAISVPVSDSTNIPANKSSDSSIDTPAATSTALNTSSGNQPSPNDDGGQSDQSKRKYPRRVTKPTIVSSSSKRKEKTK